MAENPSSSSSPTLPPPPLPSDREACGSPPGFGPRGSWLSARPRIPWWWTWTMRVVCRVRAILGFRGFRIGGSGREWVTRASWNWALSLWGRELEGLWGRRRWIGDWWVAWGTSWLGALGLSLGRVGVREILLTFAFFESYPFELWRQKATLKWKPRYTQRFFFFHSP